MHYLMSVRLSICQVSSGFGNTKRKKKKKECFPAVKAPTIQWQQGEKAMCK